MAHALAGIPKTEAHKAALSRSVKAAKARTLYQWQTLVDDRQQEVKTFVMNVPGGRLFLNRTYGGSEPQWIETMCFVPGCV